MHGLPLQHSNTNESPKHVQREEADTKENMWYDSIFTNTIKAVLACALRNLEEVGWQGGSGVLEMSCSVVERCSRRCFPNCENSLSLRVHSLYIKKKYLVL